MTSTTLACALRSSAASYWTAALVSCANVVVVVVATTASTVAFTVCCCSVRHDASPLGAPTDPTVFAAQALSPSPTAA